MRIPQDFETSHSVTEGEVWRWNLIDQPHRRLLNTAVGCVGLLRSSTPGSVIIAAESAILTTSMITPGGNPHNPMPDFATGPSVLCNRPDHMSKNPYVGVLLLFCCL